MTKIIVASGGRKGSVTFDDQLGTGSISFDHPDPTVRAVLVQHFTEPRTLVTPRRADADPDEDTYDEEVRGSDSLDAFLRVASTLKAETGVDVDWKSSELPG